MTTTWLPTDALPLATVEQLATGAFEEKIDPNTQTVEKFTVYSELQIPFFWRGYQNLHRDYYRENFLEAETWYGNTDYTVTANGLLNQAPYPIGQHIIGYTAATGAIFAAFVIKAPTDPNEPPQHNILASDVIAPNRVPVPDQIPAAGTVPPSTPRYLVGIGHATGKSIDGKSTVQLDIFHEQTWRPSTTSFSMAPGEKRTIVLTQESGVSDTSSDESSISAALGLNVSGGWGPVSASLSASFSYSQTTSHSRTITSRNISTTEVKLENDTADAQNVIYWELVDIYTIAEHIASSGKPTTMDQVRPIIRGTIECVAAPTIARKYGDTGKAL